jgi:hypothetical protein
VDSEEPRALRPQQVGTCKTFMQKLAVVGKETCKTLSAWLNAAPATQRASRPTFCFVTRLRARNTYTPSPSGIGFPQQLAEALGADDV